MKKVNDMEISGLLNKEQITARRVPLDESLLTVSKRKNWYCDYCSRHFSGEMTFMKHYCEPKRRIQELASPLGQAAYSYYREWMRLKKYSQPGSSAFLESKYYRAFVNFAELVIKANIPSPDKYIQLMVEGDIMPVLWCRDSAYAIYIEWVDKKSNPIEQVQNTVNYLFDIAEKEGVNIKDIFEHLGIPEIISLVRQRKLTPWFLFCSAKFGAVLKKMDKDQLSAFNAVINSSFWAEKFQKNKNIIEDIKLIANEVGL
jgi:hypothetical protein